MSTQKKWDKAKVHIGALMGFLNTAPASIPRKPLEPIREFLIYLGRTYPEMVPYFKGLHLTIDGWQKGRDAEGWDLHGKPLLAAMAEGKVAHTEPETAPATVNAVPRLAADVKALRRLTQAEEAPRRPLRAKRVAYCFLVGDASSQGKGAAYLPLGAAMIQNSEVYYTSGEWAGECKGKPSN